MAVPVMAIVLVEILVPVTAFVYRPWEAIVFSTRVADYSPPFYPNAAMKMVSVGDLCHHTRNAISKEEDWKIDELGFRNDTLIVDADILIVGDSYVAGTSLDQEHTIGNQLKKCDPGIKVYCMAPWSMQAFMEYLNAGKIKKPKQLIFSIVERNIPEPMQLRHVPSGQNIEKLLATNHLGICLDKTLRFLSLNWLKARISGSKGSGLQGVNQSNMFFLNGIHQSMHNDEALKEAVKAIASYKNFCDSLGIDFLFLPMPNKESVYYELVPFDKQPDYLLKLDSALTLQGIKTINTLKLYNDYRIHNDVVLYRYDDAHWNANATGIVAGEIIKLWKDSHIGYNN
jgi:hypothetical protein